MRVDKAGKSLIFCKNLKSRNYAIDFEPPKPSAHRLKGSKRLGEAFSMHYTGAASSELAAPWCSIGSGPNRSLVPGSVLK
jgi:hypothetical protein